MGQSWLAVASARKLIRGAPDLLLLETEWEVSTAALIRDQIYYWWRFSACDE